MKKFSQIFFSLLLATLFLLSFTGIKLVVHHCFHCEVTEINVFSATHHDCCENEGHHQGHKDLADNSCCTGLQSTSADEDSCDNCCSSKEQFVKQDYQVSHYKYAVKIFTPESNALLSVNSECCTTCAIEETLFEHCEHPPYNFQRGKDFVIFTHQLKIC